MMLQKTCKEAFRRVFFDQIIAYLHIRYMYMSDPCPSITHNAGLANGFQRDNIPRSTYQQT